MADNRFAVWCKVPKEAPSQSERESWENANVLRRFITTRGFHVEVFDTFIAQQPTTKRPVTMFDLRSVTSLRFAARTSSLPPCPPLSHRGAAPSAARERRARARAGTRAATT